MRQVQQRVQQKGQPSLPYEIQLWPASEVSLSLLPVQDEASVECAGPCAKDTSWEAGLRCRRQGDGSTFAHLVTLVSDHTVNSISDEQTSKPPNFCI